MNSNVSTYETHFFIPAHRLPNIYNIFKFKNTSEEVIANSNMYPKNNEFKKDIIWVCNKCGHVHIGLNTPGNCPICNSKYNVMDN